MAKTFLADTADGVLTVTLNRPERLNATSSVARAEMSEFWRQVRDDKSVRCIILTGAGRAFCAGADAEDMSTGRRPPGDIGYIAAIDFCPGEWVAVPILVAVNGLCVGGGLHFVADGDLVLASTDAWFSDPHVSVGQVGAMEPLLLAPKVRYAVLAKLVLLGSSYRMSAAEALADGLVHEVHEPDALLPRCRELASISARQSPTALRHSLGVLRRHARAQIREELDPAWETVYAHFWHPDGTEGPRAFLEKRDPVWADPG